MTTEKFIKGLPNDFILKVMALYPGDKQLHKLLEEGNITEAGQIMFGYTILMNLHLSPRDSADWQRILNDRRQAYQELYK